MVDRGSDDEGAPLVLIAIGLSFCYQASVWNIGAEGQSSPAGAILGGSIIPIHVVPLARARSWMRADAAARHARRHGLRAIPAWLKNRFNTNETPDDLMLVYVANSSSTISCAHRGAIPPAITFRTASLCPAATLAGDFRRQHPPHLCVRAGRRSPRLVSVRA